jgi:outer membrane biosynthesis protein TonB
MANAVQTKLQKISGEYSAKVADMRKLETDKRKPFVTDAQIKDINTKIKKLDQERLALNTELNKLTKLAKTAEEYIKLNKEFNTLQADITKAEQRGESTTSLKQKRTGAVSRLKEISPEVERNFPEIKVPAPKISTAIAPTPGPTGTPVQTPNAPTPTPTPTPKPSPTTTPKPSPTPTPKPKPGTPAEKVETPADRETEALNAAAGADFTLPETLFKNIPSLNALLKKYVSTPGMTPDAFRKMLRDDVWYKQNSGEIKKRYVQYYNYRDLQASGRAQGTTDYEMQIEKIVASLTKRAATIGSAAASDPAALRKAAENLYITNRSEDESFIDDFLAASIRTVGGMIGGKGTQGYSGQALTNYQELVKTARSNGFQISDIIPGGANEQQVLQGIASGKLDINRIIQDARKLAAQGQPQYVRDLLAQGYNLDQVFAPYRQTMAAVLEIDDPNSIDLNDPLLRSAISDKGDMNVYDFKKALRKDNRWQYTEQARQDVSSATLDILRDFGFQG